MVAAAVWLVPAGEAAAAPVCPEQTLRTPYMTAVTTTLACTDSMHPIVRYLPFQYPYATVTVSGNQATITPGPSISNTEVVVNYRAENAVFESTIGFLRVQVGSAPMVAPPLPPSTNRPPVARCDSYSVKPGENVSLPRPGVLANDSDPDGDSLRVESAYGSDDKFPRPDIAYNGRLRFQPPNSRRMLSYRYIATDGPLDSESTVTFWVGMEDKGCRPPSEPEPLSEPKRISTLVRTGGSVRIRVGNRWRRLGARYRLRRALTVDARRGSVRVRLVSKSNWERTVMSGSFAGGRFKLGRDLKAPNGRIFSYFNTVGLAGGLGCPGPGRRLDVAVRGSGFIIDALRLRTYGLAVRNRLVLSRFRVADRCNATSVVELRRGRVRVQDHNKGEQTILNGRRTYVAHGRGSDGEDTRLRESRS
jgi:hypothetical protein